jgi:KDO2-lipid IV(A) lauroyltransferase
LRPVLRALARGEGLGVLADQHGEAQEAVVRLLGRPVAAPAGPAFFAARTGAVVLPMRCVREADGRHRVLIEPPLAPGDDVEAAMQALYATYERWIRERPDHWLWVHDRWAREAELVRAPGDAPPAPALTPGAAAETRAGDPQAIAAGAP